jgi:hypothetical protein
MEIFEAIARPRSKYLSVLPERCQHITRDVNKLRLAGCTATVVGTNFVCCGLDLFASPARKRSASQGTGQPSSFSVGTQLKGHQSSTGKPLTLGTIKWLRYKHRIPAPRPPEGTLTVRQMRERYGVSLYVVHYWIERGIVCAAQRKPNAPYAITIDDALDQRLRRWVAHSSRLPPLSPTQPA